MCVKIYSGRELPVHNWVAEHRLPVKFDLFKLCWSKYGQMIYFVIEFFHGPIIHVSQNAAMSALEALRIQACFDKVQYIQWDGVAGHLQSRRAETGF